MLKIQFLNGGLANQAFQYIFAKHYELSHPGQIMYLDDSYITLNPVHNGYELDKVFGIQPHMLSEAFDPDVWEYMLEQCRAGKSIPQILKDNGTDIDMLAEFNAYKRFVPFDGDVYMGKPNEYDPDVQNVERNTYFYGYWINKGWFDKYRTQFLAEFEFPIPPDEYNRKLLKRICTESSVGLHVRRGDFVQLNVAYNAEQYRGMTDACINEWGTDAVVYVFSDDIPWCRENSSAMGLDRFREVVFVEGNTDGRNYIDMQLMSSCDVIMVDKSSFAFLAALLSRRRKLLVNKSGKMI